MSKELARILVEERSDLMDVKCKPDRVVVAITGSPSSWLSRITLRLLAVWAGVSILVLLPVVEANGI